MLNLRSQADVLGDPVIRILDPAPFLKVLETPGTAGRARTSQSISRYVEQTIVADAASHLLVCILRDVTDEETEREKKESDQPPDRGDCRPRGG